MARRLAELRRCAGWGVCFLLAGCLFRSTGEQPPSTPSEQGVGPVEPLPEPNLTAEAKPEFYSPYRATGLIQPVARLSGSLEPPPERVRLEVTPVPPRSVEKKEKKPPPVSP